MAPRTEIQVSIPCHVKRSVRISRTPLSCWLRTKGYETYRTGRAFGGLQVPDTVTGRYRASPYSTVSNRISLRLDVNPSPQVLQIYGRLYHLVPASRFGSGMPTVGRLGSPGITPVHSYYVPIRHPLVFDPLPGRAGYRVYLAPDISDRDEEGFSSCLVCPCQRAVATTPPEGSIRRPVRDQSYCLHPTAAGSTSGATHFRGHLCIHFRYGPLTRSPPLRWLCRWASGDRFP